MIQGLFGYCLGIQRPLHLYNLVCLLHLNDKDCQFSRAESLEVRQ